MDGSWRRFPQAVPSAWGERVSISIDSQARPHIAFQDDDTRIVYGVKDEAWNLERVPTAAGMFAEPARHVSMQLQPGRFDQRLRDAPHVAFQEALTDDLCHIAKIGGQWRGNFTSVDSPQERVSGLHNSLVFNSSETCRIAYFEEQQSEALPPIARLKLATLHRDETLPDGTVVRPGGWETVVLVPEPDQGTFCSMAGGTQGRDLIAYFDRASGSLKAWVRIPLEGIPEPRFEIISKNIFKAFPSAADRLDGEFSAAGEFRVAFADVGNVSDQRPKLASRNRDGTWSVQVIDDAPVDFDTWPCLAYDKSRKAHVAYVSGGTLRYSLGTE